MSSLCVVGDSICAGVSFNTQAGRYSHLEDCFVNLLRRGLDADIKNDSKFGCKVTNALERLERYAPDIASSPYTLVMLGGNDSDYDWPRVAESPIFPHEPNTPMPEFLAAYGRLLDGIIGLGSRPVVMNITPIDGQRYFDWFSQRADGVELMRFLKTAASVEHGNEFYSVAVTNLAIRRGLPFVDARSALLRPRHFGDLLCVDGIHPTVRGHRAIYEHILPQLREILA